MYDRTFFTTPLGRASLASIAAMVALIAFSTQLALGPGEAGFAEQNEQSTMLVELA